MVACLDVLEVESMADPTVEMTAGSMVEMAQLMVDLMVAVLVVRTVA
jgi:hypothetical protein